MMAKSHFWVVCDAVDYIQRCGSPTQKAALQTFQMAYGERGPVAEIPSHRTAVAHLVGYEAWHTDKFGDLVISMRTLPRGTRREAVGIGFNMFTAFNHFINPYPETEGPWPDTDGYSYNSSSMRGFDSLVVTGISRYLHGLVDVDSSLVLDRIKSRWRGSSAAWEENFKKGLNDTQFAPWNVLASAYYSLLLRHHHEPLEVRGPNSHIVGLQLLGPVAHAVTDCCSVQHVRSTLGFGHSVWENYIKAKVYNRQIKADPDLVGRFLVEEPFARLDDRLAEGPLKGRFDLAGFLRGLSMRTAHRLEESTRMTWKQLWKAEGKFWRRYLTGSTMRDDAQFLYNMAVAGTVHLIEKSCADLVAEGVVDPNTGLVDPGKMPDLKLIQDERPEMPSRRRGPEDVPSEELMPVPLSAPEDLLGFVPIGETHLTDQLRSAMEALAPGKEGRSDVRHAEALLKDVEWSLTDQYRRMEHETGRRFSPLSVRERIPLDSDLSAHFGTGTFRLPSEEECDDPESLEQYIDLSDAHAYRAGKLELTQRVAALRHLHNQALQAGEQESGATLERLAGDLETVRGTQWADFSESFDLMAVRQTGEETGAARAPETTQSKGLMARLTDRFSFLFEVPVTALATAAAVAVLMIFVYPRGMPEQVVGLSTEAWEKPHKLKLMGARKLVPKAPEAFAPAKETAAVVIQFKYFGDSLDQKMVNEAYRAVAPNRAIRSKYDVLDPAKMRDLLAGEKGPIASAEAVTSKLRANAGVIRMLVVTVEAKGLNVNVKSVVEDLGTGQSKVVLSRKNVSRTELAPVLRESAKLAFPVD
jgi:hypothetical protein